MLAQDAVGMLGQGMTISTASSCELFEVGNVTTRPRSRVCTKPVPDRARANREADELGVR
jgi:hypothetical protein